MVNFTSNTYQMKREILSFSNKISRNLPKPEKKFIADMNYGILASGSCLLTDIVDHLHEPSRKINIVDRLSRHLAKGTPKDALKALIQRMFIKKAILSQKLPCLRTVTIPSVFFQKFILQKKRILPLSTISLSLPWNEHPLCLKKQPLSWIAVMTTIRCS